MELAAVLTPAEAGGFVVLNPETGTTSEGESLEDAIANLREAIALDIEEFPQTPVGHPVVATLAFRKLPKLPRASGAKVIHVLERFGFKQARSGAVTSFLRGIRGCVVSLH